MGSFRFLDFVIHTKSGLAASTMLAVLLISLATDAPFLCVKSEDVIQQPRLSYGRAAVVSLAAGAIVLCVPRVIRR